MTDSHIPVDIQEDANGDEDATDLPVRGMSQQSGATGQLPVHQPETMPPTSYPPRAAPTSRDPAEEDLSRRPG